MIYRRWMLFVDGENFTIEGEKIAKQNSIELFEKPLRAPVGGSCPYYVPGVYVWLPPTNQANDAAGTRRFWPDRRSSAPALLDGQRSFYYTAIQGSDPSITETQESLWNLSFEPVIFKKPRGKKAKGVDIAITKDMLVHAFDDNYDLAVLLSSDRDFVPTIEEVKRRGKRVLLIGFAHCLNAELRRSCDEFFDITPEFLQHWKQANERRRP